MTKTPPKDIGASVRARLLRLARERGEDFDGDLLTRAIRATFERRKTPLPVSLPVALTATFADNPAKKTQWSGFARKAGVNDAGSLADAVESVAAIGEKLTALFR